MATYRSITHSIEPAVAGLTAITDAYMTVELVGQGLYDPVNGATVPTGLIHTSPMSVAGIAPSSTITTSDLMCNNDLKPIGSHYIVRVYVQGTLDSTGKPRGGKLIESWRMQMDCLTGGYPPAPTPLQLRTYAQRLDGAPCA